ncbi:GAF domain-containing protein [Alteribacter natronophilus]|uniref:GAF domain-containing protein n=1 Tax=Alteribacter natronophilus TaxID=2583810 RepID=UPI00110E7B37|nr:GAF domain-containing protein [Alteribacter natronophilus]TMW70595.1 GAF domain-containing protein [Alteribacter natronophilus]
MSIATDVASLKIMADIYQRKSLSDILQKTVDSLHEHVSYIDWAGIYFVENVDEARLMAASDEETDLSWESNAELKFPLEDAEKNILGVLVVKSREAICFDVTDVSTLEEIAAGLAEISFSN